MSYFQKERIEDEDGPFSALLNSVLLRGHIALDDVGRALQEYKDTCQPSASGLNLADWISDQIVVGRVREYKEANSLRRAARNLGLPNRDYKWIGIALGAQSDLIVTEDIDLFEPKAKAWPSAKKQKLKCTASGGVAKLLKKNGIRVRCASAATEICTEECDAESSEE